MESKKFLLQEKDIPTAWYNMKSSYVFRNLICSPCRIRFPLWELDFSRNGISWSKWPTEKAGRAAGRNSQIFACQLARSKNADLCAIL